jgi:hypothetical protein
MKDLMHVLLRQSVINRNTYISRIIKQQSSNWETAQVRGYDGSTGLYSVETTTGSIVLARAITTGSLGLQQQVSLSKSKNNPIIDAMPK